MYGTEAQLRDRINRDSRAQDSVLKEILEAATRNIDRACNRWIEGQDYFESPTTATVREYAGSGSSVQWIDDCIEITLVEVLDSITATTHTSWAATDWIPFRGSIRAPNFNALPYSGLMTNLNGDYSIFTSGRAGGGSRLDYAFGMAHYGAYPGAALANRGPVGRAVPTVRVTARYGYSDEAPPDIREASLMQSARWWKRFQSAMSDTLASADFGILLYRQALDADIRRILVDGRYVRKAIGRRY